MNISIHLLSSIDVNEIYHTYGLQVSGILIDGMKPLFALAAICSCVYGFWQMVKLGEILPFAVRFFLCAVILAMIHTVDYAPDTGIDPKLLKENVKAQAPIFQVAAKMVTDGIIVGQTKEISQQVSTSWSFWALSNIQLPEDTMWHIGHYHTTCIPWAMVSSDPSVVSSAVDFPLDERVALVADGWASANLEGQIVSNRFEYQNMWKEFITSSSLDYRYRPILPCTYVRSIIVQQIENYAINVIGEQNWLELANDYHDARSGRETIIAQLYKKAVEQIWDQHDFLSGKAPPLLYTRVKVFDDGDNSTRWGRWKSGFNDGVNSLVDLWTAAKTELGAIFDSKAQQYQILLMGPYFWGFCVAMTIIIFPFFVVAAFFKFSAFFWWIRLYLSVKIWPLFWGVLYAFYSAVGNNWGIEDRGMILAYPYIFLIVPVFSYIAIHSAFGFIRDGVATMVQAHMPSPANGVSEVYGAFKPVLLAGNAAEAAVSVGSALRNAGESNGSLVQQFEEFVIEDSGMNLALGGQDQSGRESGGGA